jgi:hypothetical protein
MSDGFT